MRDTWTHTERQRILWYFCLCLYGGCCLYVLCTFLCAYRTKAFYRTHANNTRICLCFYLHSTSREQNIHTDSHTHTQTHTNAGRQQSMQWVDNFYRWVRIHRQLMNLFRRKTGLKVPFHLSARLTHAVAHMMSAFELHSLLGIPSSSSLVFLFLLLSYASQWMRSTSDCMCACCVVLIASSVVFCA